MWLLLSEIAALLAQQTKLNNAVVITGITTDSRNVSKGMLFATWKGEHCDGHQFCEEAVKRGASALLVNRKLDLNIPQIIVPDTIKALGELAHAWRLKFDIPVIGVTGSNGKTTVKNMLAAIFSQAVGADVVLAPQKSFNNHVGVPLTLFQLSSKHRYAVIEMGMNHFGEIDYLTRMAQPTIVAITNAAESHLAGVGGTVEGVAKAKGEIVHGLVQNGIAVFNADDAFCDFWKKRADKHRVMTFGIDHDADVMAKEISLTSSGVTWLNVYQKNNETQKMQMPLLGRHNIANALVASSIAFACGVSHEVVAKGLASVKPEPHRLELKHTAQGVVIIDDAYNANPNSTRKAIDVLKAFESNKRVLVLGDMRELGETSKALHEAIGSYAKKSGIEALWVVGEETKHAIHAFGEGGQHFESHDALIQSIKTNAKKDDVFLVKGSLSMNMISIVDALI